MGTVVVSGGHRGAWPEGCRWKAEDIKRAYRRVGKISTHNPKVTLPRSDPNMAYAAAGRGLAWEEHGRQMQAQAWSPGPVKGTWWYLVWARCAWFPGEIRLADVDVKTGAASLANRWSYDPSGHLAHRHDGSKCYGTGYGLPPCAGCEQEAKFLAEQGK